MNSDVYGLIAQIVPVVLVLLLFEGWLRPASDPAATPPAALPQLSPHERLQRLWRAAGASLLAVIEVHALVRAAGGQRPSGFWDYVTIYGLWAVLAVILIATAAHHSGRGPKWVLRTAVGLAVLGAVGSLARLVWW